MKRFKFLKTLLALPVAIVPTCQPAYSGYVTASVKIRPELCDTYELKQEYHGYDGDYFGCAGFLEDSCGSIDIREHQKAFKEHLENRGITEIKWPKHVPINR